MPRELRDQVYSYLWTKDTVNALDYSALLQPTMKESKRNIRVMGQQGKLPENTPRFVESHIVGEDVAFEAMAWLYSNSVHLKIDTPVKLASFFDQDVYGYGLSPKDYKLRALKVEVPLGMQDYRTFDESDMKHFHLLLNANLKPGFRVEISFLARPNRIDFRHLILYTRSLSQITDVFRKNNIEVTIKYTGEVFHNVDAEFLNSDFDPDTTIYELACKPWTGSLSKNPLDLPGVSVITYNLRCLYIKLMRNLVCSGAWCTEVCCKQSLPEDL
jgi:hypothetical protein